MSHLVVLGRSNRDDAEKLFDLTGDLARQQLLQLENAAHAWRGKAVFILARSATVAKVIDALKPYGLTVIQTNLTRDREDELVEALQS